MGKDKRSILSKISPQEYRIYGIFDFEEKRLVYVHMDVEQVEWELDFGSYDEDRYDLVEFFVKLV